MVGCQRPRGGMVPRAANLDSANLSQGEGARRGRTQGDGAAANARQSGNWSNVDAFGESIDGDLEYADVAAVPPRRKDLAGQSLDFDDLTDESPDIDTPDSVRRWVETSMPPGHSSYPFGATGRGIFCSRTLNLRSIKVVGYDMDYTLVHYDVDMWEGRAYDYAKDQLRQAGCPVEGLSFDSEMVIRGLVVDKYLGNLVKPDRFGMVKRASHGTRTMTMAEVRATYGRECVDLADNSRWVFLNTLFSVSEATLYAQMVNRLDEDTGGGLGDMGWWGRDTKCYESLWRTVSKALFYTHVEGELKAEIIRDPEKFVELEPQNALALLDQKRSGKKLLLITNSDYVYTRRIMEFAYDRFLPDGMTWRDLFDITVVSSAKPGFFANNRNLLYEVATEDGLLRPTARYNEGGVFAGGSARMIEESLGVAGDDIVYVGDHIYTDVSMAKVNLKWRTCLVVRELEREVQALEAMAPLRRSLKRFMNEKERISDAFNAMRLELTRRERVGEWSRDSEETTASTALDGTVHSLGDVETGELQNGLAELMIYMEELDTHIVGMLGRDGSLFNRRWGYISLAGLNDKSHLTRQIEKYADIYTSRVSNFLHYTPYMYFRSPSQSLAHDRKRWSGQSRSETREER